MCPIYEFYCNKCQVASELLVSYKDSQKPVECKDCKNDLQKQISTGNFVFKGDGFYINDKNKK